jgi:uncharacterized RDD family membrane protein YckC
MAEVHCRYCRMANDAEEHRCTRCGRRLHLAVPHSGSDPYPLVSSSFASSPLTATAAARALESFPAVDPAQPQPEPPKPEPPDHAAYQPSLFREGFGAAKVIPIPTLTPARSQSRDPNSVRRAPARQAVRPRRLSDAQQALEFGAPVSAHAGLDTSADLIYCDTPVAIPGHRLLAAAVDASMVLIALGLFAILVGMFLGGDFLMSRQATPFLIFVGAVIALFYRSIWYFGNGDSPGMRFAGLRLVDFDGRRPDREQRGLRQAASLLSLLAAGLGMVWAMVDEESLTWHDHISKTFPTPN